MADGVVDLFSETLTGRPRKANATTFRKGDPRTVAAGSRGGKMNAKTKCALPGEAPPAPHDLPSAKAFLSWVSHAVLVGKIDSKTADAATRAARSYIDGEKLFSRAEQRLKELEAQIRKLSGGAK